MTSVITLSSTSSIQPLKQAVNHKMVKVATCSTVVGQPEVIMMSPQFATQFKCPTVELFKPLLLDINKHRFQTRLLLLRTRHSSEMRVAFLIFCPVKGKTQEHKLSFRQHLIKALSVFGVLKSTHKIIGVTDQHRSPFHHWFYFLFKP